jgi:uncharacterized protein YjiS (DUF1127 family)
MKTRTFVSAVADLYDSMLTGHRAGRLYTELSGLSDSRLGALGISRSEIASYALRKAESR